MAVIDSETVFCGLVAILIAVIVYPYVFPSYPDTSEYFLANQSSVASLRREKETAIYRSLVSPHGRPLLSGLSIADSSSKYTTRDGNLSDVWELAAKAKLSSVAARDGKFIQVPLAREELVRLVYGLGKLIDSWKPGNRDVAILLPNGMEALICFFASVLFGHSAVFIPTDNVSSDKLDDYVATADPAILIGSGDVVCKLKLDRFPNVKSVVSVHGKVITEPLPSSLANYSIWIDLLSQFKEQPAEEFPIIDEIDDKLPLKVVYEDVDESPKIACFTHKSVVSAIAAQIQSIPLEKWSPEDRVLTYSYRFDMYNFVLELTALVSGSLLVFVDCTNLIHHPLTLISEIKPTILITDDTSSSSLASLADELKFVHVIRLKVAMTSLGRGVIPKTAIIPELSSLRLIHTSFLHTFCGSDHCLTTLETNIIRCLAGARVIHALSTPLSTSPIAQTGYYDYRDSSAEWVNFGPLLACLEGKLEDFEQYSSEKRKGRLLIRGHSLPSGTVWVNTGIIAYWGADGCLKLLRWD
jgi:hypothetical protein